jgi:lysozyme family protein
MTREEWKTLCERELGKPYIWGENGPDTYDCSGFVQVALRHIDLDPPSDQTAAGLYRHFSHGRSTPIAVGEAGVGDLIFFGNDENITHVALAWGSGKMLEAGGGGRKTTTVAIARQQAAKVRISNISRRSDLVAVLSPDELPWSATDRTQTVVALEAPVRRDHYTGEPIVTEWLDNGRDMRLRQDFGYVDAVGRGWPVPAGTVVDGASIPKAFWSLIGGPFEGLYRKPSVVHDYYCEVKTRPWRDTHRIFYDGMLCAGVGGIKAKTMYYAVYRFGPRWTLGPSAMLESFQSRGGGMPVPASLPVESFDAASFELDAKLIQDADLEIDEIEALANARYRGQGQDGGAALKSLRKRSGGQRGAQLDKVAQEATAAFLRQPLEKRLVALQDAVSSDQESEAVGALLANQARSDVALAPSQQELPLSFEQLEPNYNSLWTTCVIRPERAGEVAWHRKKLVQYRARYEAVAARTGVPWWFIGVVHALEGSFNFNGHLHNGDPLSARTILVPKGRPLKWNPPNDWESSAVDALTMKGFNEQVDWSIARALYRWESYNGFGYYGKNINSPYLWSFSNHYTKGKFTVDHKYDANFVSKQCGAGVILRALQEAGLVDL